MEKEPSYIRNIFKNLEEKLISSLLSKPNLKVGMLYSSYTNKNGPGELIAITKKDITFKFIEEELIITRSLQQEITEAEYIVKDIETLKDNLSDLDLKKYSNPLFRIMRNFIRDNKEIEKPIEFITNLDFRDLTLLEETIYDVYDMITKEKKSDTAENTERYLH